MRKQCMVMSRNNYTPVQFWLSMPLVEFLGWIRTNNALQAEKGRKG